MVYVVIRVLVPRTFNGGLEDEVVGFRGGVENGVFVLYERFVDGFYLDVCRIWYPFSCRCCIYCRYWSSSYSSLSTNYCNNNWWWTCFCRSFHKDWVLSYLLMFLSGV